MDPLRVHGEPSAELSRHDFDLQRRLDGAPAGVCHAPFASLHLAAGGAAFACRFGQAPMGRWQGVADLRDLWRGEAARQLRERFAAYEVRRDQCRRCVGLWEDRHVPDSPAIAGFDGLPLRDQEDVPAAVSADLTGEDRDALLALLEPHAARFVRCQLTLDGARRPAHLDRFLEALSEEADLSLRYRGGVPEPAQVPPRVTSVSLGQDMEQPEPDEAWNRALGALATLLAERGTALYMEVPVHRHNWLHLGRWWAAASAVGVPLRPVLLDPAEALSLAAAEAHVLAVVHAVLYRWSQDHGRPAPGEHERMAVDRLMTRLRRWQRRQAGQDGGAEVALPPIEHPILRDERETLAFLKDLLRIYQHPQVERWLDELARHPRLHEEVRTRCSWRVVVLWLASVFSRRRRLEDLRLAFEDRAAAAARIREDREQLAGSPLEGWYETWIREFRLLREGLPERPFPRGAPVAAPAGTAPRITVLVPSYNHEAFLQRTLESVLGQTAPDLRLVVVDDKSSDGTVQVARAVEDPRLEVRQNERNMGLGPGLAAALERVDTPFVAFLNSDDLFHPERLARCLAVLEGQPACQLVATTLSPIDPTDRVRSAEDSSPVFDGRRVHEWLQWHAGLAPPTSDPDRLLGDLLKGNFLLTSSNVVGRTDWIRRHADQWRGLEFCVDWQLFLLAAAERALTVLPEPLLGYRLHPCNTVWFDEERQWRYYVEAHQVVGRVLEGVGADGPPALGAWLGLMARDVPRNAGLDGAGLLLGRLLDRAGLHARDLTDEALQGMVKELVALQEQRNQAAQWRRDFGEDLSLLYRMRGEYRYLDQLRLEHEALLDEHARLQGRHRGVLEERQEAARRVREVEAAAQEAREEAARDLASVGRLRESVARLQEQRTQLQTDLEQAHDETKLARQERDELRAEKTGLEAQLADRTAERDRALTSPEYRLGRLVLDKLHLRTPLRLAEKAAMRAQHAWNVRRMGWGRGPSPRIAATACWNFPIYSQTFVYQELVQLMRAGCDLRFVYSHQEPREHLADAFRDLWPRRRRLVLHRDLNRQDQERYRARLPDRYRSLVRDLCEASGLSEQELEGHDNFRQAFSFTRMVEAYGADYLHSYFFYDRSLMALVAGHLLDLPRGVSCYADHVMDDYELKVVPLHLRQCAIVIATSQRIKDELLQRAPDVDPDRILVKPNAIDGDQFPVLPRQEPGPGRPFRLVAVNRIEPKKGLTYLVEAVRRLRETGFPVELHILGEADPGIQSSQDCRQALVQQIERDALWGTVHLEGRQAQDGIRRHLSQCQLFLAPFVETDRGDKDGIPTALLEGMATGLPALATDAGSIHEVITPDVDGVIVPQRDPEALAARIRELLEDPARRAALGRAGAATVRARFDVRVCEGRFHQRLNEVLAARGRPGPRVGGA